MTLAASGDTLRFGAHGISIAVDLRVGHIESMTVETGGRALKPLHRAPWVEASGETVPDTIPDGQKYLSGDFLCAPFSASDIEPAPLHGWPPNSRWSVVSSEAIQGGWCARMRLDRRVMGATIDKLLTVRDGHPFLYQEHVVEGGSGGLPVSHHAMTVMAAGGRLAFSPKRRAETGADALETDPSRGRSRLKYPATSPDLTRFPAGDGTAVDLTDFRTGTRNEDFLMLVEAASSGLGWTAVARRAEADVVLVLKNVAELPVTMLWISDGGRDYAPWNGRHLGVLGIEDGRTAIGHRASVGDNALRREGIPTAFDLGGRVSFRHVIGALPAAAPGEAPTAIEEGAGALKLTFADGTTSELPFDGTFLRIA